MYQLMARLKAMHDAMPAKDPNRKALLSTLHRFNAYLRKKGRDEFPLT